MFNMQHFQELKNIFDNWIIMKKHFEIICDKLKSDFESNGFRELLSLNDNGAAFVIADKKYKLKMQSDFINERNSTSPYPINIYQAKMILSVISGKNDFGIDKEIKIKEYVIDNKGNIDEHYTKDDFIGCLLGDLIKNVLNK
jgi:hypothetical protein